MSGLVWEQRGNSLYATRMGQAYLVDRRGMTGAWVLRKRWVNDSGWDVVGEYSTRDEAKEAAL